MTRRTHHTACRLVLGCLALPVLLAAAVATAAEKPAPDNHAAVAPEPAAPAPAAPPAAKPTAPPANGDEKVGTVGGRNLWETFQRGGPLMYPILACSVIGVAFAIERLISLRQSAVAPKHLAGKVLAVVGEQGPAAGIALCEQKPSAMARVLAAGLALVPGSREDITTAMQEAGERELWHLERFAKPLNVIAGVSPLLGLLGTVWGMIMAFDVVAAKGALGDPRELAEGIAAALLTTFAGLSVAIPAYVLYHYFRSKSDRMIVEIEETASHLVARLQGAASHAHPAPQGGGRGAAADAAD